MKASELIVKCLENEGVQYIFGVPGEENIDLMDALLESQIRFVTTHHEQGAAFMAAIMGRLTGKPGVCLSTLGPGATNLITGVADGNMDRCPLVAISGQAGLDRMHKESHQTYDLAALFRPVTKWNASILSTASIPEIVRKAFQTAASEKPGASHIVLPEDIAGQDTDGKPLPLTDSPSVGEATAREIERALDVLNGAKRPVILAGNGITRQRAGEELRRFAEKLNAPVVHTFMGTGAIPWDHPLCLMTAGLQEKDYASLGLEASDLIIAAGFDIIEYHPYLWNPQGRKPVLHIDTVPAEIDAEYPVRASLTGSIGSNLSRLTERLDIRRPGEPFTLEYRKGLLAEIDSYRADDSFPLKPQRIVSDLGAALGDDDIVLCDTGSHKMWMARMYPAHKPNTLLISNGFASMGIALPGAIAAKLARPERKVAAVIGDGAFQMSLQELETAVRLQLDIVLLIWEDGRYNLIEKKQMKKFQRASHIEFGNPDYVALAKAYGAEGRRVEGAGQLPRALEWAFGRRQGPVLLVCPVDHREKLPHITADPTHDH